MAEYFEDGNDNYIPDGLEKDYQDLEKKVKEKRKDWKAKIKAFFADKKNIVIVSLALLLVAAVAYSTQTKTIVKEVTNTVKQIPNMGDRYIVFDTQKAEVTKTLLANIKDENGEIEGEKFVVWYRLKSSNGNTLWVTSKELILKNSNQLKYNKVEFDKMVERETKEAQSLSK